MYSASRPCVECIGIWLKLDVSCLLIKQMNSVWFSENENDAIATVYLLSYLASYFYFVFFGRKFLRWMKTFELNVILFVVVLNKR